jgi:hypothetical protein
VLVDLDRILQRMDLLDIPGVGGVDQGPDRHRNITRADHVLCQGVAALAVDDFRHVMIFIDDLHRHETFARIGQGDLDRSGIEIEDGRRIERVAVEADHRLIVDPRRLAAMQEFSDGAAVLQDAAEIQVGFGAGEVVDGDRDGVGGRRLRSRLRKRDVADSCKHKARKNFRVKIFHGFAFLHH